jgi:hypothetical protein
MKDRNGIQCCEEIARIGERGDITIRHFNGPFYLGGKRAAIEAAEWASKLGQLYEMQGDIILDAVQKSRKNGTIDTKTAATLCGKAAFCYKMCGLAKVYSNIGTK